MIEQRLIDANILSTSFGTLDWHCYNDCQHCNMKYGTCEAKLTMDDVLHNINSAPTVDAEPVIHGHWILRHVGVGHYWECSVCRKNPCIYITDDTNYCPHCGAKMDEEGEHDENLG